MEPLPALSQQEMISKIKFVCTPCIGFQPALDQLKNGAIYLQIVSHFHPNIIDMTKINFKGASLWEAFQNFELLSRVLEGERIPFTFDIQKLALPNLYEHFRLSCFLFEALQKGKGRTDTVRPDPRSIQVLPPRNAKALLLQKNLNAHISLAELEYLHPKRSLKEIECSINQNIDSNNQLEDHEQISNLRDSSQKNFITMNLSKAKQLNETYYNTFKITQKSQLNFYSFLRHTTLNFLKNTKAPLSQNQQQAISQCLSIHKSFRSINCLFYGINKDYPQTQQSLLARQNIRRQCRDYYRSIGFIRTIVQNDLRKMKFKTMTVAYLHKFQILTQRQLTKKQFESINKQEIFAYFQTNFSADDGINTNPITSPEIHPSQTLFTEQKPQSPIFCTLEAKEQNNNQKLQLSTQTQSVYSHQTEETKSQSNNNKDFSLSQSKSDENQYWTIHRITLIAYELQYVHKKDPFYIEDDEFFYKRSDHSKFTTGFLFTCRMGEKRENIQDVLKAALQQRKYPRFVELFGGKGSSSEGSTRLREFVRIMLSLKHPAILHEFAAAYDVIIAEIDAVSFAEVKGQQRRFAVVDKITQKLRANAAEIDRVLKGMLSLTEGEGDTISVLRATVYCFLAEKFVFHTNELWAEAFCNYPRSTNDEKEMKQQ